MASFWDSLFSHQYHEGSNEIEIKTGVFSRNWGILKEDANGNLYPEVLIPSGIKIAVGEQKAISLQLRESSTEFRVCAISFSGSWNSTVPPDARIEEDYRGKAANVEFPNRRISVMMSLSNEMDSIIFRVTDSTGNVTEKRIPADIIKKGTSYKTKTVSVQYNTVSWSGYYTGYYSDGGEKRSGLLRLRH